MFEGTKETGSGVCATAAEFTLARPLAPLMTESMSTIRKRARASTAGPMETGMREAGKTDKDTDMEFMSGRKRMKSMTKDKVHFL